MTAMWLCVKRNQEVSLFNHQRNPYFSHSQLSLNNKMSEERQYKRPVLLPSAIRKYSGKITIVFCLEVSLILGMETAYIAVFAGTPTFDQVYLPSSMLLQGLLQGSYMLMAACIQVN